MAVLPSDRFEESAAAVGGLMPAPLSDTVTRAADSARPGDLDTPVHRTDLIALERDSQTLAGALSGSSRKGAALQPIEESFQLDVLRSATPRKRRLPPRHATGSTCRLSIRACQHIARHVD